MPRPGTKPWSFADNSVLLTSSSCILIFLQQKDINRLSLYAFFLVYRPPAIYTIVILIVVLILIIGFIIPLAITPVLILAFMFIVVVYLCYYCARLLSRIYSSA